MDSIKLSLLTVISLLTLGSCKEDSETRLIFVDNFSKAEGALVGDLYSEGIQLPLFSNLKSDDNCEIMITNLLEGTYRFNYYVLPSEGGFYPPIDTVFQLRDGQTLTINIE